VAGPLVAHSRRLHAAAAIGVRLVYAVLLYTAGLLALGGCGLLLAIGWSERTAAGTALGVVSFVVLVLLELCVLLTVTLEVGVPGVIGAFAACAVLGAAASGLTMWKAREAQVLHDRGVIERAVVVAEQHPCSGESCWYSYTLRSVAGPVIRPDLDSDNRLLTVGRDVMVLADPRGKIPPSLDTRLSARKWLVASIATGGAGAAGLAVVAWWAAPAPTRRPEPAD
jgi:hypothetical protein